MKLTTEQGHFWIEFDNGYTLSVFNGYGSHTENNFNFEKYMKIVKKRDIFARWESETTEIAILNPTGDLVTDCFIETDDSVKTVDLKELIEIINLLNNYKEVK